jgi:hypothetical protein
VLRFVHNTRQRVLRLRAITCPAVFRKHKGASRTLALLATLTSHATALHQAPEHLFHSHHTLATQLPVPLFDVQTARDITARGILELPSFIGDIAPDLHPQAHRREQLVTECNALVLQLLHAAKLPSDLQLVEVPPLSDALFRCCNTSV